MSAKPSASCPDKDQLWNEIRNVLEPLFTFPDEALHTEVLHPMTYAQYSAAYTGVVSWVKWCRHPKGLPLYPPLDDLVKECCRIMYTQLEPFTGEQLLRAYHQLYANFLRRAATAKRMLTHLDIYVWPSHRDMGCSSASCSDYKPEGPMSETDACQYWLDHVADHERGPLIDTWEMPMDSPVNSKEWIQAVERSEAGHDPTEGIVIKTHAMILRRWRITVLEPLLAGALSTEHLVELDHHNVLDHKGVGLLLQSMREVGVRADNEKRMRLQELYAGMCSSA
jgi:hypothetical protein